MDVDLPLMETGVVERWGLSPSELAICCGFHGGDTADVLRSLGRLEEVG